MDWLRHHFYAIGNADGPSGRVLRCHRLCSAVARTVTSTPGIQLQLLGGFALSEEILSVAPISLRKAQAMLAYLALKATRSETREALLDLLWPDRFKEQAQASLRQVLFELRAAVGSGPAIIEPSRGGVALGPAVVKCDVWNFEGLAARAGLDAAEQMLQLYRGPLLDGVFVTSEPFQQWLAIQRARLERQLEDAVLRSATIAAIEGADGRRAVQVLLRLVDLSPMCCQAIAQLMQIEAARGHSLKAVQHYERYADRLRREFDEEPPPQLEGTYQALRAHKVAVPTLAPRPAFVHRDPWIKTRSDAPIVAVLPFRYEGKQEAGAALASALSEDITLMLSGCRWFSVLSRSATHSLRGDATFIPKEFAQRTGADYLVYGAITERAECLSLGIELAQAETGHIRWAKKYDATGEDHLSWASEACPMIVAALDPAVVQSECASLRRPALATTGSATAYQHLVLGYRHFYAGEWTDAKNAFQAAIREDATYAHAHAMLAMTIYLSAQVQRDDRWAAALQDAEGSARRALEIDPSDAKACNILGQVLDWQGRHEAAAPFLERTMSLNPGFALASTARSYHAVMTGAYEAAKSFIQTAMRLRVGDAGLGLCLPSKALADLHLGNVREALQTAHWSVRLQPTFWLGRQVLAACLSADGSYELASTTVAELREDYPDLSGEEFVTWFPYASSSGGKPVREAFHRAGWY